MPKILEGYTAAFLVLVTLVLLVFHSYKKYVAPYTVFPQSWAIAKIVAHFVTGRIPKDTTMSCFVFQSICKDLEKHLQEGYCVTWLPKPYVMVFNEEAVKILSTSQAALNKAEAYHAFQEIYENGLVTSDEKLWRKRRKLIQPAFNTSMLKNHLPNFNRNAIKLVQSFMEAANEPVEIERFLKKCTLHNLLVSAFGLQSDKPIEPAEEEELIERLDKLGSTTVQRAINPLQGSKLMLLISPQGRQFFENLTNMLSLMNKIVLRVKDSTVKRRAEKPTVKDEVDCISLRKSFVEILVDNHLKDPSFTMEGLREEAFTLLVAGYDTVAYALTWCLFLLGHHPEVQDQVYDEVKHLKGKEITYEDVKSMMYTECVIKETLRLYPVVPIYAKRLVTDMQCGKYNIPKGTNVGFCSYVLHRNPEVYPNPEKFDPERFRNGANKNPWSYTPFAEGLRYCLGKKYAMIQMKIVVAYLIQNFRLKSLQRLEDVQVGWEIVLVPNQRIQVSFTPRRHISQG